MQSHPFTLDHLSEYRQADLQAAALDARSKRYSGQANMPRRLTAWLTALVSRGNQLQAQPSAPSTNVRPVVR